ncbi:MAG: class I SAM-dependent methyltransferase, partial [Solirubrobacteraceae bacterium]
MPTRAQLPDSRSLRRFVTLVDLDELVGQVDAAGAYFRTFSAADDATLLVHAVTDDPDWAAQVIGEVIAAGGATPETCADVQVCIVDDEESIWHRFARRAHVVLGRGRANWVLVKRPTYEWGQLTHVREYAERLWGARAQIAPFSYEDAIAHVVAGGSTTEQQVRLGSVPEASLQAVAGVLDEQLASPAPRLPHVGNFVGISLAYLLDWARARDGFVISVDPDIAHRGVAHPQRVVCDLLSHFGLSGRHLLICGYTLDKCFSNDGVVFDGYDPAARWVAEAAPENVLPGLAVAGPRFDAVFVDGNHDAAYLRRELRETTRLLETGGVLVLDDVDDNWEQIRS